MGGQKARLALDAMKNLGFSRKQAIPVLERLFRLFNNQWEPIEADSYCALAEAIVDDQLKANGNGNDNGNGNGGAVSVDGDEAPGQGQGHEEPKMSTTEPPSTSRAATTTTTPLTTKTRAAAAEANQAAMDGRRGTGLVSVDDFVVSGNKISVDGDEAPGQGQGHEEPEMSTTEPPSTSRAATTTTTPLTTKTRAAAAEANQAAMDGRRGTGLVSVDDLSGGSQVYFLTRLHGDLQVMGLEADGEWRHGLIYCSDVTAHLLESRFPGVEASLLRPIAAGASASLSLSCPDSGRPISIQVTAIPALHCPGSLMYLFRGDLGCMLYTGDFRWELGCDKAESAKKALLHALAGDTVEVLYLDNTYCHPEIYFPPRHIVAEQIVDIIRAHPDHEVILGIDALGKEDLLLYIAKALQTKIWVWPQRLETIHILGIDDNREIFTTQTSLTKVRAVPRYGLTIESLEALNTVCPTIGIMPSGIPWLRKYQNGGKGSLKKKKNGGKAPARSSRCKGGGRGEGAIEMDYDPSSPPKLFKKDSYALPYSDHACFAELDDFMQTVRPSTVLGIVSDSICYGDPLFHFSHLCGEEACSDKTPVKRGRHAGNSVPKRRPSASKTPEEKDDA